MFKGSPTTRRTILVSPFHSSFGGEEEGGEEEGHGGEQGDPLSSDGEGDEQDIGQPANLDDDGAASE